MAVMQEDEGGAMKKQKGYTAQEREQLQELMHQIDPPKDDLLPDSQAQIVQMLLDVIKDVRAGKVSSVVWIAETGNGYSCGWNGDVGDLYGLCGYGQQILGWRMQRGIQNALSQDAGEDD